MTVMVLDGNSVLNRAYFGVKAQLSTADGTPTGALLGFVNTLLKLKEDFRPDCIQVTFDVKGPTFRHESFEGYKAKRRPMPDDLAEQLPLCKELLDAWGIPRYELPGYEGDDLLGTIAKGCKESGDFCLIVTGDRDCFQLVDENVHVLHLSMRMGQTSTIRVDVAAVQAEYGFEPKRIVDLKALMGDSSDNIPGVPGVGEKTALTLLHRFGSLDGLYAGLDTAEDVKDSLKKKLRDGEDLARLSFDLATIRCDAPITFVCDGERPRDEERLLTLLQRLELRSVIKKLGLSPDGDVKSKAKSTRTQGEAVEQTPGVEKAQNVEIHTKCVDVLDISSGEEMDFFAKHLAKRDTPVPFVCREDVSEILIALGERVYRLRRVAEDQFGAEESAGYSAFLSAFFAETVPKLTHHVKPLMRLLLEENISYGGFVFDTALAAYLLNPTAGKYPLEVLVSKYFAVDAPGEAFCVTQLPALMERQREELEAQGLTALLTSVELPLCDVLAHMEYTGVAVSREKLAEYGHTLRRRLGELEREIFSQAGHEFNIGSTKQLAQVLFDELLLPPMKKNKTGPSTDIDVLSKLAPLHPIIPLLIEYRHVSKLISTYVDGLMHVMHPDGRLRTNFQMTVTATGRLSSTDPNLQNIPIRQELGGELRRFFVAGHADWVLVDADYSQIELRILAHMTGDPVMRRAFSEGQDIHSVTASQVFGVPESEVTNDMRRQAKAVNFGIVYGISAFSLSDNIGVSVSQARQYIEQYLENFSGVRQYMKDVVKRAEQNGFVSTLLGRRRELPELYAKNANIRAFGQRVALNAPIQGTAADIIKLAMIAVYHRLQRENLRARLILQVHDELILECPREEKEAVMALLKEEMEGVYPLNPSLVAEAHWGENWLDSK